ncbi:MAG: SigE family RNA polymerase sigma factor [Streptosporangiaceae bacterium]
MGHDETGYAEFFEASWEPCLRAVAASTGDMVLAEDQVAEAFARAWVSWRKVSRHPAPRAWVVRTALNAGASWWRRRARELPLGDHDVAAPGSPGTGLDTVVLTALRRLPARQREVIVLRVFLDLDIETTARHLAIAPGTVRAHLSRAVTALRSELANANTTEADPCPATIRGPMAPSCANCGTRCPAWPCPSGRAWRRSRPGAARAGATGSPRSRACPWPAPPLVPRWSSA